MPVLLGILHRRAPAHLSKPLCGAPSPLLCSHPVGSEHSLQKAGLIPAHPLACNSLPPGPTPYLSKSFTSGPSRSVSNATSSTKPSQAFHPNTRSPASVPQGYTVAFLCARPEVPGRTEVSHTQRLLPRWSGNQSQLGEIRLVVETPLQVRNTCLIIDFLNFSRPHLAHSFIHSFIPLYPGRGSYTKMNKMKTSRSSWGSGELHAKGSMGAGL